MTVGVTAVPTEIVLNTISGGSLRVLRLQARAKLRYAEKLRTDIGVKVKYFNRLEQ